MGQIPEKRICLTQFPEIGNSHQGHIQVIIDQFFSSGDNRQVQRGFRDCIQSPYMGNQARRVQSLFHQVQRFLNVVCIAPAGPHNMGKGIVHIVKVQAGAEAGIGRTGKKVQATIEGQQLIGLFNDLANRGKYKDVIIPLIPANAP